MTDFDQINGNLNRIFPEHKKDMKEYAGIVSKQEAAKIKIWVYGLMGLGAVMIITNLVSWVVVKK